MITIHEYWRWLDVGFVTNLNSDTWYNGDYDNYTNGYLSDKVNRLIGWATMRQLRIRAGLSISFIIFRRFFCF
jgi:hypothetical protein